MLDDHICHSHKKCLDRGPPSDMEGMTQAYRKLGTLVSASLSILSCRVASFLSISLFWLPSLVPDLVEFLVCLLAALLFYYSAVTIQSLPILLVPIFHVMAHQMLLEH